MIRDGGPLPVIIQGGMGVGVSSWQLARAVARRGHLGIISGTAIDLVHHRLFADGDPGGHLREAYAHFPVPALAEAIVERSLIPGGRDPSKPYTPLPLPTPDPPHDELARRMVAAFAEVWLARDGHDGPVGMNLLDKLRMSSLPELAGAVLAGADAVIMGAGIPTEVPGVLDALAEGRPAVRTVPVDDEQFELHLDPREFVPDGFPRRRPDFLAIVSSHTLARFLVRDPAHRPDGLIVEAPTAGGHNAPPRDRSTRDADGNPTYGARDEVDLEALAKLEIPFWLAGSWAGPEQLTEAQARGAVGIQVGSAFALCEESGMEPGLRAEARRQARDGTISIRTDHRASPSGFPFKVAAVEGTAGHADTERRRVCDIGLLREAYHDSDGEIAFRCPAEPAATWRRKGGSDDDLEGRLCLCNGLVATIGLGQVRPWGGQEPPLLTLGDDAPRVVRALSPEGEPFGADDVIDWLLGTGPAQDEVSASSRSTV